MVGDFAGGPSNGSYLLTENNCIMLRLQKIMHVLLSRFTFMKNPSKGGFNRIISVKSIVNWSRVMHHIRDAVKLIEQISSEFHNSVN